MKNKPEKPENTRSIKPDEGGQHAPDYPTGSITGNILGLINGDEAIPQDWVNRLRFSDLVMEIAQDLEIAANNANELEVGWLKKYPGY
jgi:hypothetical protein